VWTGAAARRTAAARANESAGSVLFGGQEVEWWEFAACAKGDAETFFPRGRGVDLRRQVQAAKAVCAECPVRKKCLSWALTMNVSGVWGGCSEYERRRIRATANAAA
jgi:WhiB family redox-sensing transcriptional regulator